MCLTLKSRILIAAAISASIFPNGASADTGFEAIPTAWRLQDYLDNSIVTYNTGSSCASGRLLLPASAPDDSKQRYWSIVMSAKLAQKTVGIFYNVINGECTIASFFLKEG